MADRYSILEAVNATGLEESEIRFFEQVFREFLQLSQMDLDKNTFNQDHIDILARIKDLTHNQNLSIDEVKRELKAALRLGELGGGESGLHGGNGNGAKNGNGKIVPLTPYTHAPTSGRLARVIAVTSGKGGVGKSSVTVNLAIAFAQAGKKVAIFDADLGLANVHILMGVKARYNIRHIIEDNFDLDDIVTVGPLGIKIISGGQGVRELANMTHEQRRTILRQMDRLEREVDILLLDTGAGIGENVLRFATFADEIICVTTPNVAAAADGYSIIKILLEMEPNSKIGLIANMAQSMYHSKNVFNRINVATKKYLKYPLGDLGYVVQDEMMEKAMQKRSPIMLEYPDAEASKCIRAIAATILDTNIFVNERKQSCFDDLMGQLKRSVVGV